MQKCERANIHHFQQNLPETHLSDSPGISNTSLTAPNFPAKAPSALTLQPCRSQAGHRCLWNFETHVFVKHLLFSHFCLQLELWELKINILACELLIHTRESFHLVFHVILLCFVQMDLYEPAAIQFHTDSLAHDFTWED